QIGGGKIDVKRVIAWMTVSLATSLGALVALGADPASGSATQRATPTTPAPAAATPAATASSDDVRFPRELSNDKGKVIVHAPQVQAWPDYERVDAIAAIEVTFKGKKPVVGSARFTASTVADVAAHTVTIYN